MNLGSRFRINMKNLMIYINFFLDSRGYRRKKVEGERESNERGERIR